MVVVMPREIDLAAYDRLYIWMLFGQGHELLYPVHIAMVSEGYPRLAQFFGPRKKVRNRGETVKNRVLAMYM